MFPTTTCERSNTQNFLLAQGCFLLSGLAVAWLWAARSRIAALRRRREPRDVAATDSAGVRRTVPCPQARLPARQRWSRGRRSLPRWRWCSQFAAAPPRKWTIGGHSWSLTTTAPSSLCLWWRLRMIARRAPSQLRLRRALRQLSGRPPAAGRRGGSAADGAATPGTSAVRSPHCAAGCGRPVAPMQPEDP